MNQKNDGDQENHSSDKPRVAMSPAVEENFGHCNARERLKHADYLRDIARQLEVSAKVMLADEERRECPVMVHLAKYEVVRN